MQVSKEVKTTINISMNFGQAQLLREWVRSIKPGDVGMGHEAEFRLEFLRTLAKGMSDD